jgi:hypothetical protein
MPRGLPSCFLHGCFSCLWLLIGPVTDMSVDPSASRWSGATRDGNVRGVPVDDPIHLGVVPAVGSASQREASPVPESVAIPSTVQRGPGLATRRTRSIAGSLGFVFVNVWLLYHLAAIVIAPWSVQPSSRLVQNAWRSVGAYVQILFLNHGYHYFAPEPGNSTLVAYVLEMPDGRRETGRIPNRGIWPRLLYHRHFMLTEFLASSDSFAPAVRTELLRAMARELCREHGARRVTLSKVTHRLPTMERIRAGGTLDDNYAEEPLGTFTCDGL